MADIVLYTSHQALVASADMAAIVRDNFSDGEGLAFRDLARYKLGAGGVTSFLRIMNTPEGGESEEMVSSFEAVIVDRRDQRAFWSQPLGQGETRNPDCKSSDGLFGHGNNGTSTGRHDCASCPMNQFGSKVRPDGQAGRGKGCKQTRLFFLITPSNDSIFPSVLQVPPGSLGNLRSYSASLTMQRKSLLRTVHRFSLEKAKNADGTAFAKLKIALVRDLQPEELQRIEEYRAATLGMIQRFGTQAVEEEVRQEQTGDPFPAGQQHATPPPKAAQQPSPEVEFEVVADGPKGRRK